MSGLIHVYCGDGKGKTTASIGLSIRACGCGHQIIFAQFMKSWDTGELQILSKQEDIILLRGNYPAKFSKDYTEKDIIEVTKENLRLFQEAISHSKEGVPSLLVFDEIIGAMNIGLMDQEVVYDFLRNKPELLEVVLTGRNPSEELIALADYVSEIKMIKHPYEKGINARKGIEF